ncbi:MAG: hypothetical protein QM776_17875 [Rhodocyclaceae bacterium]
MNIELPDELAGWGEWLSWFPADLVPDTGDLLRRLHPLLGPYRGYRPGGVPEPDGLGDLHRRGSYERLLASEWLYADEMPDEFLRRAAAGEHLFLAPRPRARQADKLIVALFDAGPRQLGAPRLAQLAMWILLARRAREAGGDLRWGVLQEQPSLNEANQLEQLRKLLRARSYVVATDEHRQQWRDWLEAESLKPAECWLIGPALPELPQRNDPWSHRVSLRVSINATALDVAVRDGGQRRAIQLTLPNEKSAAQLLQGQFTKAALTTTPQRLSSPDKLAITLPPILGTQGNHVAVPLLEGHGVLVFHIPRKQSQQVGKPKRQAWPSTLSPLALAFSGKKVGGVLSGAAMLDFWQVDRLRSVSRPPREQFEASSGRADLLSSAWCKVHGSDQLFVLDQAGRLIHWKADAGGRTQMTHFDVNVLGMAQMDIGGVVYLCDERGQLTLHRSNWAGKREWTCVLDPSFGKTSVLFAGASLFRIAVGGCAVRYEEAPERWRLYTPSGKPGQPFDSADVTLPAGWQAIGFVLERNVARFSLVLLGPQRNALVLFSDGQSEALYMTASPIRKFSVSPDSGDVAMLTDERELIVYSVRDRAVRLIMDGRGEARDAS